MGDLSLLGMFIYQFFVVFVPDGYIMALSVPFVNTSLLNISRKWTGSTSLPFWRDVWNSSTDDTGEKVLLRGYCQGMLDRATVEEVLKIGRSAL